MTSTIKTQIIEWGSVDYFQTLSLRNQVLRKPLGLVFDPAIFPQEQTDLHIVAKQGDCVVGCMILTRSKDVMKMRQVAVTDRLQRHGIGKQMVEFAERESIKFGCKRMVLHARDTAMMFYLSLGYTTEGQGFEEVGIPHHRMFKQLID
jgi:predicted GNAT family N-acyltransferase